MNEYRTITRVAGIALLVLGVLHFVGLIVLPFLGYDYYCHLFWIGDWHRMWQAGIYYPRWLADSYRAFGAPSFYFYPPLTYVLSSSIYAFSASAHAAVIAKIEIALTLLLSGVTMSLYLRWRAKNLRLNISTISLLLPTLAYVFAPYRYFDYQIRSALSEHVAFIFVPLIFWGIDSILSSEHRNDARGFILLTISYTLLLNTNLPTSALVGISLVVYVLAERPHKQQLVGLVVALLCAVLLAAFYLIPVAALYGDAQLSRLWIKVSSWYTSPFTAIFTGKMITINTYALLMVIGACIALWGSRSTHRTRYKALLLLTVALQLPFISQYLFTYIPPFTIVQLSYRFSAILVIVIAMMWQDELGGPSKIDSRPIASSIVALWSLAGIAMVSLQLSGFQINKHIPLPVDDAPEYAPRWSRPYYDWGVALSAPFKSDSESVVWQGPVQPSYTRAVRLPYSDTVEYENSQPATALFRRSYWPTWQARIDDKLTAVRPDSLGRAIVEAPAGRHKMIVWLETERSAEIGTYISISTLLLFAIGIFTQRKRSANS